MYNNPKNTENEINRYSHVINLIFTALIFDLLILAMIFWCLFFKKKIKYKNTGIINKRGKTYIPEKESIGTINTTINTNESRFKKSKKLSDNTTSIIGILSLLLAQE